MATEEEKKYLRSSIVTRCKEMIAKLPETNKTTLEFLLLHLRRFVCTHSIYTRCKTVTVEKSIVKFILDNDKDLRCINIIVVADWHGLKQTMGCLQRTWVLCLDQLCCGETWLTHHWTVCLRHLYRLEPLTSWLDMFMWVLLANLYQY